MERRGENMKIIKDLQAFVDNKSISKYVVTIFLNPCFHSVCLYRASQFFYKIKLGIIAKIIWYLNRMLFHVDIDYRAELAPGFVIVHGLGIVVGRGVVSKGKLKLYQGVTIGGTGKCIDEDGQKIWMPIIGDNVTVYTDAKLLGPIHVQDNAIIKAGSIVSRDFPDEE